MLQAKRSHVINAQSIAIAKPLASLSPFYVAYQSALNSARAIGYFMYGTQSRANITVLCGLATAAAAMALQHKANTVLPYCI